MERRRYEAVPRCIPGSCVAAALGVRQARRRGDRTAYRVSVRTAGVSESPAYDIHSSFDGRNLLASASSLRPSFDLSSNDAVSASSYTAVNTAGADEAGGSSVVRQEVDSSDNSLRDNCSHEYRHNGNNGGKGNNDNGGGN